MYAIITNPKPEVLVWNSIITEDQSQQISKDTEIKIYHFANYNRKKKFQWSGYPLGFVCRSIIDFKIMNDLIYGVINLAPYNNTGDGKNNSQVGVYLSSWIYGPIF